MQNKEQYKRILCIDGGGILGTYPAAFLAELEKNLNEPISRYFDLIVGTSTGGILAIGIGMGLPASDLLSMYEDHGPKIFGQDNHAYVNYVLNKFRWIRHFFRRKYSSEPLREVLQRVLGEKKLGESKTRLIIPAWNPEAGSVHVFKTSHHERLYKDYRCLAVDAAMATAAAPTYFSQHVTQDEVGLIDGGIWANNPIAISVVEAISILNWNPENLKILSIGCVDELYTHRSWGGVGTLGKKIIKLFMDGQSHSAMNIADLLTNDSHGSGEKKIFRINHTTSEGKYLMDDVRAIGPLKKKGREDGFKEYPLLKDIFFTSTVCPFVPAHKLK